MGNRICNKKNREYIDQKQDNKLTEGRGDIGDRSTNLTRLIGAEAVSKRNFIYEGTLYVTEDGETFDKFRNKNSTTNILQAKNMDRSRTRRPPDHKRGKTSEILQQNSYQSGNNKTIRRVCTRSKILAVNQKI